MKYKVEGYTISGTVLQRLAANESLAMHLGLPQGYFNTDLSIASPSPTAATPTIATAVVVSHRTIQITPLSKEPVKVESKTHLDG
jgi:hypothetical protein